MDQSTIYRTLALCLILALVAGIGVYYYCKTHANEPKKALNARKVITVIAAFFTVVIVLFMIVNWIPEKFAIKGDDFKNYEPYILVQEVHYTGTGWAQVGNEEGYFLPDAYVDINLINGTILPQMYMYNEDYANTFLCKIEYKGKMKHHAFENEIDSYYIVEWYPIYPVLRDTILPNWMYPKGFMTKQEIGKTP